MKSYNHLFEKLVDCKNIDLAITNSSRRKGKRDDVKFILKHREEFIHKIRKFLISGKFKPQTHNIAQIFDKSSKKKRLIVKPYFYKNQFGEEVYEQIIHHAVMQVLSPIFMRGMYDFSCGSIPKRGGSYGKKYLDKYIREHNENEIKYCCKFDFHHYYLTIGIDVLKQKLQKIIHDEKMLKIIFTIIDSNIGFYEGKSYNMGLPIGFYTSQWLANFFLQDLDHYIKEVLKIKCYVRYVDDVILFSSNKRKLHKDFIKISEFIKPLNLTFKSNYQVFKFDNKNKNGHFVDFMGFRFYRNRTTLRRKILLKATRKARKISKKLKLNFFDASQILSYSGWFKHTKTFLYVKRNILNLVNFSQCKKLISKKNKGGNHGI